MVGPQRRRFESNIECASRALRGRAFAVNTSHNVLIVEGEPEVADALKHLLEASSCTVEVALAGDTGLRLAQSKAFDLIVLDPTLPGLDGLEVCRRLRTRHAYTAVLMLSAHGSDVDRVAGLQAGADDYITTPYSAPELMARVQALFRRVDALSEQSKSVERSLARIGRVLSIDTRSREVRVRGQLRALTRKEYDLLLLFARNPGRVYTRAQLLDAVWGYSYEGYEHAIECHINRLRAKIEANSAKPKLLRTVWGIGYKFTGVSIWSDA